jgi:hypothetical protein
MNDLNAAQIQVLNYAQSHISDTGFAEIGDDIGLPDHIVESACKVLKSKNLILDYGFSEESVEYIRLK